VDKLLKIENQVVEVDSDADKRIKELEAENAQLKEQNEQAKSKNEVKFFFAVFKSKFFFENFKKLA
jgi:lipopolysaccharide export system protein LptC